MTMVAKLKTGSNQDSNPDLRVAKHKHQGTPKTGPSRGFWEREPTRHTQEIDVRSYRLPVDTVPTTVDVEVRSNPRPADAVPKRIEIRSEPNYGEILRAEELRFGKDIDEYQWECLAKKIRLAEQSVQWWIGDLWNACRWGTKAEQMAKAGFNPGTAERYAKVCKRFPIHECKTISFAHHQLVAQRDDAKALLAQAEQQGLSIAKLRDAIRESEGKEKPPSAAERLEALAGKHKELQTRCTALEKENAALKARIAELTSDA